MINIINFLLKKFIKDKLNFINHFLFTIQLYLKHNLTSSFQYIS
jgi:hypothetical protein